ATIRAKGTRYSSPPPLRLQLVGTSAVENALVGSFDTTAGLLEYFDLTGLKKAGFGEIDKYGGMLVNLNTAEWTNGGNNSFGVRGPAPRENPNWSVTPNLTVLRGNHNMRGGFWFIDAKRIQENTFQTYTFADDQTGDPSRAAGLTGYS